jgi:hypothetical protein
VVLRGSCSGTSDSDASSGVCMTRKLGGSWILGKRVRKGKNTEIKERIQDQTSESTLVPADMTRELPPGDTNRLPFHTFVQLYRTEVSTLNKDNTCAQPKLQTCQCM